jgi:nicotinate-nucleotide adenylyltransferase
MSARLIPVSPGRPQAMRIGIFGGSFDPIHLGHLISAEQAREQARLEQVWFVPAARPPHKQNRDLTPFPLRVEMLEMAIAGHTDFRVCEIEKELFGPSYTVETLRRLQQTHPGNQWFLLMGSDSLRDFPSWREPDQIATLATLVVIDRPSDEPAEGPSGSSGAAASELHQLVGVTGATGNDAALRPSVPSPIVTAASTPAAIIVRSPLIDISSSNIRHRVREGRSIRYLTPRAVECFIAAHRLYR